MNICLVLISDGWGGTETVVYGLARHLRDKGENVSIILNQEIFKFYDNLEGIEIFNIGYAYNHKKLIKSIIFPNSKTNGEVGSSSFPWSILNEFLRPIYFRRIRKEIMKFLSNKKINLIESHLENSDILLLCYFNNLEITWIERIGGPHLPRLLKEDSIRSVLTLKKRKARMLKDALYKIDRVIFVSDWLLNAFKNIMPIENKSVVIRNGIKLSDFQRESIPTLKLKGDFNLLFPGGPKPSKGGDILIEALNEIKNEIPDIHLYVALDVPQNHLLRKMVKDLGLKENVTFLGFLQKEKYKEILNSVDALIQPYREESFGIVCLEAMALGKPIIAGNKGLPKFVKNGRHGIFTKPEPDAVADAILYLYKNEDLRREIGRNNLEDIKNFDWSAIVDKYIDVYRKTLAEKG